MEYDKDLRGLHRLKSSIDEEPRNYQNYSAGRSTTSCDADEEDLSDEYNHRVDLKENSLKKKAKHLIRSRSRTFKKWSLFAVLLALIFLSTLLRFFWTIPFHNNETSNKVLNQEGNYFDKKEKKESTQLRGKEQFKKSTVYLFENEKDNIKEDPVKPAKEKNAHLEKEKNVHLEKKKNVQPEKEKNVQLEKKKNVQPEKRQGVKLGNDALDEQELKKAKKKKKRRKKKKRLAKNKAQREALELAKTKAEALKQQEDAKNWKIKKKVEKVMKGALRESAFREAGFPKKSGLYEFATNAEEKEMNKHDGLILQGMMYMQDLTDDDYEDWTPTGLEKPTVCINIYVSNRKCSYINTLMMSLMNGQTPSRLMEYAKVNVLNTERRSKHVGFSLLEAHYKLPFLQHYNFSALQAEEMEEEREEGSVDDAALPARFQFILDTIRGLQICIDSGLPWCLMMEEDALVPVNFIELLDKFVISPIENDEDEISVLSLFSNFNNGTESSHQINLPEYSKMRYDIDRAKSNEERYGANVKEYTPHFDIVREDNHSKGSVALLYPIDAVRRLLPYLQQVGTNPMIDGDVMINHKDHFPHVLGRPRRQVEPSLVNHIGYYEEGMGKRPQLSTDVRFTYDAGPYGEQSG